jgi:hypothetical protein
MAAEPRIAIWISPYEKQRDPEATKTHGKIGDTGAEWKWGKNYALPLVASTPYGLHQAASQCDSILTGE